MTKFIFVLVCFGFITCGSASAVQYFSEPLGDVSRFLNLGPVEQLSYDGKTEAGEDCQLSITRTENALVFSPSHLILAPRLGVIPTDDKRSLSFILRPAGDLKESINGGWENERLWASRFIDDDYSLIHGQFGMSFRLELYTDSEGRLVRYEFRKVYMQDLGYQLIANEQCLF